MANAITDNRTLVVNADSATNWVASSSAVLDTDVKIQGTGSIAEQITNTGRYILYNMGATQNWSNNVFYIWINCGVVGLLSTKAAGGFRIRFTGPVVTDYFEFYVGGSDSWPTAVAGGWVQFVVDIEATPSATGGTPPATSAIQHVGYYAVTATVMTKVADNTWIDEIRRLPDGNPGIIVEGRNGGTTPWTFDDIVTQLGAGVGTAKFGPAGSILLNTPIRFFTDDGTTHAFSDSGKDVFWDNQEFAPTDLYGITIQGAATGTANFTLGSKTGTGDASTGALGCKIKAASAGVRWYFDADGANIDSCGLYGCTFEHGGDFQLDTASVEVVSTFFIDCTSARVDNSLFVRNVIIDANTADGVGFITTDDISDVKYCDFTFSDGHAITVVAGVGGTQTSKGNQFTGYGGTPGTNSTPSSGSTDAAVYNNTGGALTISVTENGDSPSVRNAASSTTTVAAAITITFTGLVAGTEIRVFETSGGAEVSGTESTVGTTHSASLQASTSYFVQAVKPGYLFFRAQGLTFTASQEYPINLRIDNNYSNP
jgi:hypothetical protein